MKITAKTRTIERHGRIEAEVKKVGIKATIQVMNSIAQQYSDQLGGLTREYASGNMVDAYVKAGFFSWDNPAVHSIPPDRIPVIHIPSALDPVVRYVDYGCGMTPEEMDENYLMAGGTNKSDDNTQVGGHGWGCLIAYGYEYAEAFTVESRTLNRRFVYSCYINEEGEFCGLPLADESTDEHNGTEVSFPLDPEDRDEFIRGVQKFVLYFPLPLRVTGAPEHEFPKIAYAVRTERWGIRKREFRGKGEPRIIIGGIPYPLDTNRLNYSSRYFFERLGIDFHYKIGEVMPTPNREAIRYDSRPGLMKELDLLKDEVIPRIRGFIEEQLKEATTPWEAYERLKDVADIYKLGNHFDETTWREHRIHIKKGFAIDVANLPGTLTEYWLPSVRGWDSGRQDRKRDPTRVKAEVRDWGTKYLHPGRNQHFFFDDLKRGGKGRIKQWMIDSGNTERILCVTPEEGVTIEKIEEIFGGVSFVKTSTLPAPPKGEKRVKTRLKRLQGYSFVDNEIEIRDTETYYFVNLERGDMEFQDPYFGGQSSVRHAWELLRDLGYVSGDIVGVPKSRKSVKKTGTWVSVHEVLLELAPTVLAQFKERLRVHRAYVDLKSRLPWFKLIHEHDAADFDVTQGYVQEFFQLTQEAHEEHYLMARVDKYMQRARLKLSTRKTRLEQLAERVAKKYPMLVLCGELSEKYNSQLTDSRIELLNQYL
jgi:hypothetical protein